MSRSSPTVFAPPGNFRLLSIVVGLLTQKLVLVQWQLSVPSTSSRILQRGISGGQEPKIATNDGNVHGHDANHDPGAVTGEAGLHCRLACAGAVYYRYAFLTTSSPSESEPSGISLADISTCAILALNVASFLKNKPICGSILASRQGLCPTLL